MGGGGQPVGNTELNGGGGGSTVRTEAKFLDVIGDKSFKISSLLFTVISTNGFTPPPPFSKIGLKLVCNVNIVYGNLKSENPQDYGQNINEIAH